MGHPHYQGVAADGKPTQVSDAGWDAPRLSSSLLKAPVGTHDVYRTRLEREIAAGKRGKVTPQSLDADLKDLLGHIQERLQRGVAEAWLSTEGYGERPDPDRLSKAIAGKTGVQDKLDEALKDMPELQPFWGDPEEQWARAFAELFVFSMYAEPGHSYYNEKNDWGVYEAFPGAFSIAVECQHLVTYCVLSRGIQLTKVFNPWVPGCGCSGETLKLSAFAKHELFEGNTKYQTAKELSTYVEPGSVIVYNPGGPEYRDQDKSGPELITHTAAVLRVSGARVQFMDTGVLIGNKERSGQEGGTVDHSFLTGVVPGKKSLIGVGVLQKATDLEGCVKRMKQSRPLGVVRLALVDAAGKVRFVSKLVHMRYPLSRLMWSLRGLPLADLSALWFVYLPAGTAYSKKRPMIEKNWADRLLSPGALDMKPKDLLLPGLGSLLLTNVIRGNPGGDAHIYRRKKAGPTDAYFCDADAGMIKTVVAEMGQGYLLTDKDKLGTWCMDPGTFTQRFLQKSADAQGTIDEGTTGVSFFDP